MNRNVLFVDDDEKLLNGVARRFDDRFDLHLASSGNAALEVLRKSAPFAVIISDMRMPLMDGLQFIQKARQIAKETVYMMLTGNQDLATATNAINNGHVFRFLMKPCPSRVLRDAVEDGIRQYDRVTGEHELLHATLCGLIKVLTDVLELSYPALFSRSHGTQHLLEQLMARLGVEGRWEYKLAARLTNIGCIIASNESSKRTTRTIEKDAVISQAAADACRRLILHIPRLKTVAEIVRCHVSAKGEFPDPSVDEAALISAGATLVRAAMEVDSQIRDGISQPAAVAEVAARMPRLPDIVVDALLILNIKASQSTLNLQEVEVSPEELSEGMILARNVQETDGSLLLARATRLTQVFVEKLRSIAESVGLRPLYVYKS